jgi:GNAT superfamily N-acetyltransferase
VSPLKGPYHVERTRPEYFEGIRALTEIVYPGALPWSVAQLQSHVDVFPEGQFVVVDDDTHVVIGMAASLIVRWDDYEFTENWASFTDAGMFTNHDPENGRTLYGAEVMTHPKRRGLGVGKALYTARRKLVERLGLSRIRAGARLRGYHKYAKDMTAEQYAIRVARGELNDPTVSFQISQGFHILAVVEGYLRHDPESLGWAVVIEWINEQIAKPEDWRPRDPKFAPRP